MEDLKDLERAAKDHKEVPDNATPADLCYYWTMRGVYDSLRAKLLDRDEAKAAKRQATVAHVQFSAALENALKAHKEREHAINVIGSTRTDLHRAQTLEGKYRIALHGLSAISGETITEMMEVRWLESFKQKSDEPET